MRDDGESTPFLRGRAAAGELYGAAAGTCRQAPPREDQPDGLDRFFSREQQPVWSSSRARWRRALLAVTSVGAAVLVIAVVLMSISRQAGSSPQDGGASLAAAAPREISGSYGHAGGHTVGEVIAAGGRGAGSDKGHGSKGPGGGWRPPGDDACSRCRLDTHTRVLRANTFYLGVCSGFPGRCEPRVAPQMPFVLCAGGSCVVHGLRTRVDSRIYVQRIPCLQASSLAEKVYLAAWAAAADRCCEALQTHCSNFL